MLPHSQSLATRALLGGKCDGLGKHETAVIAVTYNLFWWCVADLNDKCPQNAEHRGFERLYHRIQINPPFDLLALQECGNIRQVVDNAGYWWCLEYYDPGTDAPLVWNNIKYGWISNGKEYISTDKYGDRFLTWVRLSARATGHTFFFANTHGPLWQCDGKQGALNAKRYINAINNNKEPDDAVIFAGDFNCAVGTDSIRILQTHFALDGSDWSYGGADHIFSSNLPLLWEGAVDGSPSDHQLLKVTLQLPGQVIRHEWAG
jgi:hypothetical protein